MLFLLSFTVLLGHAAHHGRDHASTTRHDAVAPKMLPNAHVVKAPTETPWWETQKCERHFGKPNPTHGGLALASDAGMAFVRGENCPTCWFNWVVCTNEENATALPQIWVIHQDCPHTVTALKGQCVDKVESAGHGRLTGDHMCLNTK